MNQPDLITITDINATDPAVTDIFAGLIADPSDGAKCAVCDQGFTPQQWDERHSDSDGEDVHDGCCEACKTNQPTPLPDLTTLQQNQFVADQLQAQRFDLLAESIAQLRAEVAELTNQLSVKEQPHDPDQPDGPHRSTRP